MINFIESSEWGGIALLAVIVVLGVLFLTIISEKENQTETLKKDLVVAVVPGKYVIEKKRIYSIIRKVCDGLSKTAFALGLAGGTKLFWDCDDPQKYLVLCIMILLLGFISLMFSELADGLKEKVKWQV